MTVELIYLLLGVYFIGVAINYTKVLPSSYNITIDLFKLVFGIVLVVLAVVGGVKLI